MPSILGTVHRRRTSAQHCQRDRDRRSGLGHRRHRRRAGGTRFRSIPGEHLRKHHHLNAREKSPTIRVRHSPSQSAEGTDRDEHGPMPFDVVHVHVIVLSIDVDERAANHRHRHRPARSALRYSHRRRVPCPMLSFGALPWRSTRRTSAHRARIRCTRPGSEFTHLEWPGHPARNEITGHQQSERAFLIQIVIVVE